MTIFQGYEIGHIRIVPMQTSCKIQQNEMLVKCTTLVISWLGDTIGHAEISVSFQAYNHILLTHFTKICMLLNSGCAWVKYTPGVCLMQYHVPLSVHNRNELVSFLQGRWALVKAPNVCLLAYSLLLAPCPTYSWPLKLQFSQSQINGLTSYLLFKNNS